MDETRRPQDAETSAPFEPTSDPAASASGRVIDRYTLLTKIGEGGMGEVYLARQDEPIRRDVAVKIIKPGMDSRDVVARFESERQALALMDHPNIARVLDAGTTPEGRPYFVMEYVRGESITAYCDRHRLDTRERLRLLVDVCEGVQHAHQKAIIHRDIKPSNVLVTVKGSKPVPKIIDFGIAKATAQPLTEKTLFTELGQLIGTPEYMSPEQAGPDAEGIDTRTDIYSLGVLLYQLLVGVLPFEPRELREAGFVEILRKIREDDPPKPSTRLSALGETSPGTAAQRGTTSQKLSSQLRGDLDWITMKALEKDRSRRYDSPSELARDLERYLANEPVSAGPPSAAYRMRKFARRHRVAVSFASVLLVVLIAFAATMAIQATRIARERDRANDAALRAAREAETSRRIADFLVGLFETSDPGQARGEDVSAREVLDRGAVEIEALDAEPTMQATLMETIGGVYLVMGMFADARPLLEQAAEIRETTAPEDEIALAASLHALANLYDNAGDPERAEPVARRAAEIRERRLGRGPELAMTLNTLGNTLWHQDRLAEAEEVHRSALAIREATLDPMHSDIAQSLHNIGALRYFASDLAEAERMYTRSIEIEETVHGPDHYSLATSIHTLAIVYQDLGRYDEALELEQRSLAIREKVLGPDHWHVALSLTTLGNIYTLTDRADEAEAPIRRAVEIALAAWGPLHPELWWMRRSHARALIALERYDEAETVLLDLIRTIEETGDEESLTSNLNALASLELTTGRAEEAEATYHRSIAIAEQADDEAYVGLATAGLADVLRDTERYDEAEAAYRRALELMEVEWGREDRDYLAARSAYAEMLRRAGREAEADELEGDG